MVLAHRAGGARRPAGDALAEAEALRQAIAKANAEVARIASGLTGEAKEMMAFQSALLDDPALSEGAFAAIARGDPADLAWGQALDHEIAGYKASEEEYFRARASDLVDIR